MRNLGFVVAVIAIAQVGLWPPCGALSAWAQDPSAITGEPRTLTRIEQIRRLSADQANLGYPVKLTATVTYAEPSRLLYIQDDSGGIFVSPQPQAAVWKHGQRVAVTGWVSPGSHLPFVNQASMQDLGPAPPLQAKRVTFDQLATDKEDANWVEVRGVVRYAGRSGDQLVLEVAADGKRVRVLFGETSPPPADYRDWVDAEVLVQAVCGVVSGQKSDAAFLDLHAPRFTNLVVEVKAPKAPDLLPVRTVAGFSTGAGKAPMEHRVLVKGTLEYAADGTLLIRDATGAASVLTSQPPMIGSNQLAEVYGFHAAGKSVLENATVRIYGLSSPAVPARPDPAAAPPAPVLLQVLTEAGQVHALTVDEAKRGYPVRFRAVVTFYDRSNQYLFVQDESTGIYIDVSDKRSDLMPGMVVEVDGFSDPGEYAPIVARAAVRPVGRSALPTPQPKMIQELMNGGQDGQWIEVQGVVHSTRIQDGRLKLVLGMAGGQLEATLPAAREHSIPSQLVDAEVRIRGACGSVFNGKRQFQGSWLGVNSLDEVTVVRPAPADPYAVTVRPIDSLLSFNARNSMQHRALVRGVVTYRDPRWYTLFVQDETGGLYVRTLSEPAVKTGDRVEVAGFVTMEVASAVMKDAIYRRLGPGAPPAPVRATVADAVSGKYDAQLITLEARLADRVRGTEGHGLVMQADNWTLLALLEGSQDAGPLNEVRTGSLLRLTGVCSMQGDPNQPASALRVQMRTAGDVVVLEQPSWWTTQHLLELLGAGAVILLATTGWVVLLRQRVREQTEEIRRKAERETALEARYRELFDHANDIVFAQDFDGRMTSLNPAGERIFGYKLADIGDLNLASVLPPDQLARAKEMIDLKIKQGGRTEYELEAVTRDGRRIPLEISSWLVRQGDKPVGIQGIARDISERRRAEHLLREREEHFRSLIENAIDLICTVREDGAITFISPSTERMLGYPSAEMLGKNAFDLIHPEERDLLRRALQRAAQRPAVPNNEVVRFRHQDGGWRVLEGAGRFLSVDAEGRKHFVVNLHDVTEHKRLEDQLRQAQKMEAVGQLAGGVAHDFNNILAAILMNLGLVQSEHALPPGLAASLQEIEAEATRAANLTRQLLLFSRRQVMQLKPLDLNAVLDNLLKMLRRLLGENITLEFHAKTCLPSIEADAVMMEQVVMNLSVNARDAMPQGGRLTLSTGLAEFAREAARVNTEARPGRYVCLTVADTGCGMDEATLKRMFEPFFTTKDVGKGTGLGLATVYGIVKQHQGWTDVASTPGQGTTFRVFLPALTDRAPADSAGPPHLPTEKGHETILLVEDEPSVRKLVGICLRRNGYQVLEAAKGTEALDLWQEHRQKVDLLFSDMVMPEGMTGLELAQRLRLEKPDLKVVISSGYNVEMLSQNAPANQRVTYLSKPYQLATLASEVRQCLDEE